MMPLCYGGDCKTFQTVSHIHVIHVQGVWSPAAVEDGYVDTPSYHYHHKCCPNFVELAEVIFDRQLEMMPPHLRLGLKTTSECIPHSCHTYIRWFYTFCSRGLSYFRCNLTIYLSWLKLLAMNECKWCHCAVVETVRPFKLHPTSMSYICKVYDHLLQLWVGMWMHPHTIATINDATAF
jgi:hypothetical protein